MWKKTLKYLKRCHELPLHIWGREYGLFLARYGVNRRLCDFDDGGLEWRRMEPSPPSGFSGPPAVIGDVALIHPPSISSLQPIVSDIGPDNGSEEIDDEDELAQDHLDMQREYVQSSSDAENPSNIFADVFHEMAKMTKTLKKKHVLDDYFTAAFSDSMLIADKGDKQRLVDYFKKTGTT
ncbi:hypothetical protein DFH09DRAFT_1075428 [Mycena vulgaris]|nr:hypothetical protein DFH09DRAFT_1075428 [Mycena vulgaris]